MRSLPASALETGMMLVEKHRVSKITQLNHALMHIKVETQDQVTQSFDHLELPLGNWYTTELRATQAGRRLRLQGQRPSMAPMALQALLQGLPSQAISLVGPAQEAWQRAAVRPSGW